MTDCQKLRNKYYIDVECCENCHNENKFLKLKDDDLRHDVCCSVMIEMNLRRKEREKE